MARLWPMLLIFLPIFRASDSSKEDCKRPAYLSRLPQRLQGEVLEIWTDPEPETTLTYADEPVIFKPSCEWRMSRTRLLISKLSRAEYYRIFPRRGPSPPRTTARVTTRMPDEGAAAPSPSPERPATPPPAPHYSTAARAAVTWPHARPPPRRGEGASNARPCRSPASITRLPPRVQARIASIWRRHGPGMTCAEMHRKTKQIMVNLPLRLRSALGRSTPKKKIIAPPQLDCKLPHFLTRLEPALQEKLRRVWKGFHEGDDCTQRVHQQLSILKANDISVESFRMPFPSLYDEDRAHAPPRRHASWRA
ncbi:hypothetical protein PENTCL1PPCAC_19357 [Pristionchus entomophagus]|uniref:Uncharacterized protein n=1 Tax=Pristionchus entomophagus TaxID=358040 RepID=A0AAV5TRW1_9BILA|nr:hypothetical protein PENTCL1PPCAC_19357 [Pristionchus entomophagus]